jgi:hypothetical protein
MRALQIFLSLAALAVLVVLIVAIADSGLAAPQRTCVGSCDCRRTGTVMLVPIGHEVSANPLNVGIARIGR